MAVKIRLMRVGKKKQPSYRVVVSDARSPRDGRFIEVLGQYAPRAEPSIVSLDADRALHWLQRGAQPTESAAKLLQIAGVWDEYARTAGKTASAKPKAKVPKPKPAPQPEPPAATAPAAPVQTDAPQADAAEADAPEAEAPEAEAPEAEATE